MLRQSKRSTMVALKATMGGKKIKGRKRHISTDSMGNLLFVKVGAANESDTTVGCDIAYQTFRRFSSVLAFCADKGYRGTTKNFVENDLKLRIDIAEKPKTRGFRVIKKRWIVEHFFAWLGNFRRFSKDYELIPQVSEQLICIVAIVLLLNRIFS